MTRLLVLISLALIGFFGARANAASVSVAPIRLDVIYPGNSARLTVKNNGQQPVNVQVRVFKWTKQNGRDYFLETRSVVVSPPIATLRPGVDFNVRLLRVDNTPVRGEEPYRVIVDELPQANRARTAGITVAIRYALPLFIVAPNASRPNIAWQVRMIGGRRALVATNTGDVHLRIANLRVGNLSVGKGLNGYVLGRSTHVFDLPRNANPSGRITADTDQGRLNGSIAR